MEGLHGIHGNIVSSLHGNARQTPEGMYQHTKEEGIEVPFLVNNAPKWISGIVSHTSCGDIVKALLKAEGRLKGVSAELLEKFVLVERWRKVEQPLRQDSCLMKIWQAWGKETEDVQFILKRVSTKKRSSSGPRAKIKRTNSKLLKQLERLDSKYPQVQR